MIDHIDLKLTNFCNLDCDYCFVEKSYRLNKGFFNRYDDLVSYISSMNLSGDLPIIMCGGELSLVHKQLREACIKIRKVERHSDLKLSFTIYTNGYNLPPILDLLDEGIINTVNISWDGVNNKARNKSISELRFRNNMKLIAGRKDVVVRTAVTETNLHSLFKTAQFIEECGVVNWEYYFLMDYKKYAKDYFVDDFKRQMEYLFTLNKLNICNFSYMKECYDNTFIFTDKKNFCGCPGNFISIGIDGKVTGCGICSSYECIYSDKNEIYYHDLSDGYNPEMIKTSMVKCRTSTTCKYLECEAMHCAGCQYVEDKTGQITKPQICKLRNIEREVYINRRNK